MTPAKAIEILSEAAHGKSMTLNPDFFDALAMGVAALNLYRTIEEYVQTQAELTKHLTEEAKP